MPDTLIKIDTHSVMIRALMTVVLALGLIETTFVVRWYIGDTVAEYVNPEENSIETVKKAVSWAPDDPVSHWRLGEFIQKNLPPEQIVEVAQQYEKAASLSPNDYRFWMVYGNALEQSGENQRAEKALRRAIELAPSYSFPRWYMGNLLLRDARFPEAFAELRRASDADPGLRPQLFNLAWEVYNKDFGALSSVVGTSAEARAQFAQYLVVRGRFEDGLRVWNTLSDNEKRANRTMGEGIIATLIGAKQFHHTVGVANDFAPAVFNQASVGQFINGGFENDVAHGPTAVFDWQVQSIQQAQISIDPNHSHNGARSLRIVFQVRSRLDAINVSQLVPVHPNTQYDFECYVKTQKLESAATPVVAVLDGTDGTYLASSEPVPTGDTEWQRIGFSFKTGARTEAVTLRINRASCGENTVCPIFGTVWYDDFDLKSRS